MFHSTPRLLACSTASLIATLGTLTAIAPSATAQDKVNGNLIQFNNNGGWSWFQDERAIVDPTSGQILVSSVADGDGLGGSVRDGDIDLAHYALGSGQRGVFVLKNNYEVDDHNAAVMSIRPDGRYATVYAGHFTDNYTYYRVSTNPGDPTSWTTERRFNNGTGTTYSNLYYLPNDNNGQGRMYNFTRTNGWDPNILISDDLGDSWSYGGKLLTQGSSGDRPYVRYTSDGQRIHLITTEEHPRQYNNSIYYAYIEDGVMYNASGNVIDSNLFNSSAVSAPALTEVFAANTNVGGDTMQHTWTTDIAASDNGQVTAIFTARANNSSNDHRFFYATLNKGSWSVNELADAGGYLYADENDYTGLAAIDPDNPNIVYISSKINPGTQAQTNHYEIYKGITQNGGSAWQWSAVTEDSTVDNIRPIVPEWDDQNTALLWMRGTYTEYRDYDTAIVGTVFDETQEAAAPSIHYVDATTSNTSPTNGSSSWLTSGSGMGGQDNLWHQRSGFGNGNQIFSADERGEEDATMLTTEVNELEEGLYDVWVFFWSNYNEEWEIQAGLEADALTLFARDSSQRTYSEELAEQLGDDVIVEFVSGSSQHGLYRAYLGQTTVGEDGTLQVFIDDGIGDTGYARTWYDGIGYSLVPEPSSILGLAAGTGLLVTRRRRRHQ